MLNFDWISELDITIAKVLVLMAFFAPLVFAFTLKREYIYKGAVDNKMWRNLKIWILLLIAIMVSVYLYF